MKYEEPKVELMELIEREVFMTASGPITNGGSGNSSGDVWVPVPDGEDY